jgi:hypothetical protein
MLCSASNNLLVVPRHNLETYGGRSFSVTAPLCCGFPFHMILEMLRHLTVLRIELYSLYFFRAVKASDEQK